MATSPAMAPDRLPLQKEKAAPVRALLLLNAHLLVALVALVAIGGATRVMQAGLACPDWPLCYGSLLPGSRMNLQVFLEWFHRLDAFLVGITLLVMGALSVAWRRQLPVWLPWLSGVALLLVALQGGLGALTVIHLLAAGTVTAHLGLALLLVALISGLHQGLEGWLVAEEAPIEAEVAPLWWPLLTGAGALLVWLQSLLGGAMASRWAVGLCMASADGCGWLLAHRMFAPVVALLVLLPLLAALLLGGWPRRQLFLALAAAALVGLQLALGVLTLRLQLAVPLVTVGHQITAALLVALLTALAVRGWSSRHLLTSVGSHSSMEAFSG